MAEFPSGKWPKKERALKLLKWITSTGSLQDMRRVAKWFGSIQKGKWTAESAAFMGRCYLARTEYEEGIAFMKEILDRAETQKDIAKWAEASCLLGDLLRKQGRSVEALQYYERVLTRKPWSFREKWAAYHAVRAGVANDDIERILPHLEALGQEPEGSLWLNLADLVRHSMETDDDSGGIPKS
jgi:tetratricopeptide (TPR) repeat protein